MVALFAQQSNTHLPIDEVMHGDALLVLRSFPDNSVDAIVSDPPAGIAFTGKDWDNPDTFPLRERGKLNGTSTHAPHAHERGFANGMHVDNSKRARDAFIAFMTDVMSEALRCLKPGGYGLIWALPRTSHWTALALEDAGFIVKEKLYHLFGSGFPKSMAIDRAIDKHLGVEREVLGTYDTRSLYDGHQRESEKTNGGGTGWGTMIHEKDVKITAPATPEAQKWQGWGTATKPAVEEWILVQKPISEKTIAANVLRWNCGALNIDATRIGDGHDRTSGGVALDKSIWGNGTGERTERPTGGRFPSHLLLSHSLFCTEDSCDRSCPVRILGEQSGIRKSGTGAIRKSTGKGYRPNAYGMESRSIGTPCVEYGDTGSAARYFTNFSPDADDVVPWLYASKASRAERNQGCEGLPANDNTSRNFMGGSKWIIDNRHPDGGYPSAYSAPLQNTHPTVKSLSLMSWLCRLITPPDGIVLDPFLGSGSTAVAAIHEGFHFIGIEQSEEYCTIAEARIAHAMREVQP